MCGFSALVNLDGKPAQAALIEKMNSVARHRGPDGVGVHCEGAVGLGHTRLSIIDVAERANQPMVRDGHFLTYNGEIYNYLELRDTLEAKGHRFATTSDTEVLLVALIEWGRGALDRLSGMFAFVYYNLPRGELWAVRDRFGIKPLVFARRGDTIFFASEAKQILATKLIQPELNKSVAISFLENSSLNSSHETFFIGIEEIQCGEMAIINLRTKSITFERWYQLSDKIKPINMSYGAARDHLRKLLDRSVARHNRSDVPMGASLSGGIDSSVIVTLSSALRQKERLSTISTYAAINGYNETEYSRAVARDTNADIIEIEVDPSDIWDPKIFREQGYYQDQPIKGGSHYNEYALFRAARQNNLVVMLDGQGADEYFGGYGEFWFAAQYEALFSANFGRFLRGINANAATTGRPFHKELISFCRTLYQDKKGNGQSSRPPPRWLRVQSAQRPSLNKNKSFLELSINQISQTSIPYQLHSQDRNAMRWSVESRVPFLDHEIVEFVLSLPTHYKVGNGYRKRILRDSVPELPQLISQRKDKVGFASPDEVALRRDPETVREQLRNAAQSFRSLIDEEFLLQDFDRVISGMQPYDKVFYRVLSLDGWRLAHSVAI